MRRLNQAVYNFISNLNNQMIKFTPNQIEKFPVNHLSHSAIRCYMSDRQLFFKRFIRLDFGSVKPSSFIEGQAYHKALEFIYADLADHGEINDQTWENAAALAQKHFVDQVDGGEVEFGKTGSVTKSLATIGRALEFYRNEFPNYRPSKIEFGVKTEIADLDGEILPVPVKIFYDLVIHERGEISIVDHKLVTTYDDEEEGSAAFELQAAASFFTAWAKLGQKPQRMIFDQLKRSKNSDGTPQRKPYIIEFIDIHGRMHPCLARFLEVYRRVVMELAGLPLVDENGVMRFIPNPFDRMSGKESWADFCKEVDNGERLTADQIATLKKQNVDIDLTDFDL